MGEGGASWLDMLVIGAIATCLILSASIIAVQLPHYGTGMQVFGGCLLLLLMGWSIFTSMAHISLKLQSGAGQSVKHSADYQRASERGSFLCSACSIQQTCSAATCSTKAACCRESSTR